MTKITIDIPKEALEKMKVKWHRAIDEGYGSDEGEQIPTFEEYLRHFLVWGLNSYGYEEEILTRLHSLKIEVDKAIKDVDGVDCTYYNSTGVGFNEVFDDEDSK